jgi:SPP1 family predicted phage head-tail adaptor
MTTSGTNPGGRRHLITFQVPQPGKDATGGPLPFVDGDTTWSKIEFTSGKNQFGGQTFVAEATHKINMRYRAGVLANWQVRFATTIFQILYVDNVDQAGVDLDLYCVILNGAS